MARVREYAVRRQEKVSVSDIFTSCIDKPWVEFFVAQPDFWLLAGNIESQVSINSLLLDPWCASATANISHVTHTIYLQRIFAQLWRNFRNLMALQQNTKEGLFESAAE